jgi:predicted AAA+ superfamily ATPase
MYVHRQLEEQLSPFLKRKEVISIVGPRQSGKTTFLTHIEKKLKKEKIKVRFITFEKRSDLELF